ncbi:MAG: HAMP domain-containing histidine kinase [Williamsia sp.]|nr:HAMP domain-containing histidine kinase [Williamsia sp.]
MKIQTKITLLFTLLCTSIIAALSFAVYFFTYQNASQDFYIRLELRAVIAARANLQQNGDTVAFKEVREQHMQRLPNEREYIIRTDTLKNGMKSQLFHEVPADFISSVISQHKASYRSNYDFYQGILYSIDGKDYLIVVAAYNTFLKDFLYNLRHILLIGSALCILVVLSVGLIFSRQTMAPVRLIARQVQRITATSLHKRLTVKKGKDEIAVLTDTFNDLLSRLETAFDTQNNFVSNASHELNTPLTAIIGEADYALARQRSAEEYRQALGIVVQQGEKLQHITQSLVQLARSGFTESLVMQKVLVWELLYNAKQHVHSVYSQCTIQLDAGLLPEHAERLLVNGNQQLLELAVSNVLMNACKYSNSQPVALALAQSSNEVMIIIKDKGIGIPDDELKYIFDPFFRASNVRNISGYGIGLPLTMNVVKLHKGAVEIHSHVGAGTEVIIRLPLA